MEWCKSQGFDNFWGCTPAFSCILIDGQKSSDCQTLRYFKIELTVYQYTNTATKTVFLYILMLATFFSQPKDSTGNYDSYIQRSDDVIICVMLISSIFCVRIQRHQEKFCTPMLQARHAGFSVRFLHSSILVKFQNSVVFGK